MQVCTSLQTDNHASTPPLSFNRPDALLAAQPTACVKARKAQVEWKQYEYSSIFTVIVETQRRGKKIKTRMWVVATSSLSTEVKRHKNTISALSVIALKFR